MSDYSILAHFFAKEALESMKNTYLIHTQYILNIARYHCEKANPSTTKESMGWQPPDLYNKLFIQWL